MELKTYNLRLKTKKGQALLELTIFGSLVLFLLGVMISYGLRYNFQQQAQMQAFRTALEKAVELDNAGEIRGSASYTFIKDRHIPSPESPFGVGGVQPFMDSASVTRDANASATAADYDGLPKMTVHLQGRVNGELVDQERSLATVGIRKEWVYLPGDEEQRNNLRQKYSLIYGSADVDWTCGNCNLEMTIIDSCEGEVVDYTSAVRQARLIVDRDFCIDQCQKGLEAGSSINCTSACGYGIAVPWYVQGVYHNGAPLYIPNLNSFAGIDDPNDNDKWEFPNLERLFYLPVAGGVDKRVQAMGLQSDSTQQVTTDFQMHKEENDSEITTTDDIYWDTTTTRTILYNDHLDPTTGLAQPGADLQTEDYSTTRSEQQSTTWQTEW